MIKEYLENLKALEEKATKGPWIVANIVELDGTIDQMQISADEDGDLICSIEENIEENQEFIAASRTALPKLITMCEKLVGALEIIANGKVETPYSAMHRHRLARTTLKELEGMVNENQS